MKHNKLKTSMSFSNTFILLFLLYATVLLAVVATINYSISEKLEHAYTVMEDFIPYQSQLEQDNFNALPVKKFKRCDFVILDENYSPLFATSPSVSNALTKQEVDLINDYQQDSMYWLFRYKATDGSEQTVILKSAKTEDAEVFSYCILNNTNEIISGNLFPDFHSLSDFQQELLGGMYKERKNVERCTYYTAEGKERTLILFSNLFDYEDYTKLEKSARGQWLIAIPLIAGITILFSFVLLRRLKKALNPLEQAMIAYGEGKRINTEQVALPLEFQKVVNRFDTMLDQIEASQQMAVQASQEKQRVLADISHDIKTPLTVIQCYSKALADHIAPDDKQDEYAQVIYARSEMMAGMVTALVDYTRLDHPDFSINGEKTDFCEFCRVYFSERYQELSLSGFELEIDIPEQPIYYDLDPKLMRRVLENLTNNALKYNPAGTVLFVELINTHDAILLCVGDNGVGIPQTLRENLFLPFVSGNSARTTGGGSGLGLFIVQRIVELHGGQVTLCPSPREGLSTEFRITLPK